MKNFYYALKLLVFISFSNSLLFGQQVEHRAPSFNFGSNQTLLLHDYIARDNIKMESSSQAIIPFPGAHINLKIDKEQQFPITYQMEASNTQADPQAEGIEIGINKNLPVGSIAGSAGVSSSGSATYDFSIYTPPGTNGMVPHIGVYYNSSSVDGLLGRGWNISGISSITRVPKTIYHNGDIESIKLDATDLIALDGNRLIASPASGANTFRPEKEDFSLITSVTDNSVAYFQVQTKDGLTMEYGKNVDSRLVLKDGSNVDQTLTWYLNKVSDNYGNYMTYSYNNSEGEVTLKEIAYTGNAAFAPYNLVHFYYDKRKDENIKFVAGNQLKNSLIVREIEVYCEGKSMKRYKFNYVFNLQSYLREITEYGADNTHFNSTFFNYGAGNSSINESLREDITPTGGNSGTNDPVFSAGPVHFNNSLIADFNGDGKSDQLVLEAQSNIPQPNLFWKLYLNNNEVFEEAYSTDPTHPSSETIQDFTPFTPSSYYDDDTTVYSSNGNNITVHRSKSPLNYAQALDMNADGLDDLVLINGYGTNNEVIVYFSNGKGFKSATPYQFSKDASFLFADIDGDGLQDGIVYYRSVGSSGNSAHFYTVSFNDPLLHTVVNTSDHTTMDNSNDPIYKNFRAVDFDGDGKQELMAQKEGVGVVFIKFNFNVVFKTTAEVYSTPMNLMGSTVQSGDFNGDGINDFIHIRDNWWTKKIEYGTGKGYVTSTNSINVGSYMWGHNTSYLVFDMNDDGNDDLIRIVDNGDLYQNIYVNYSGQGADVYLGNIPRTHPASVIEDYSFYTIFCANDISTILNADFDGDGRQDIFFRQKGFYAANSLYVSCSVAHFNKGTTFGLMQAVNNGYRNKTEFTYKTLVNGGSSIYSKGSGAQYPLQDQQTPLYVVTKMESPDGIGGKEFTSYKYDGLKVHLQGLGSIGFDKMTTYNSSNRTKQQIEYGIDNTYYERYPSVSKTFLLQGNTEIPLTERSYISTTVPLQTDRTFTFASSETLHDIRTGSIVVTSSVYDPNNNGILTEKHTSINGNEQVTDEYYTPLSGNCGGWMQSKIASKTIVNQRVGELAISRVTNFYYDDCSTGSLTKTISDPGSPYEAVSQIQYNTFGLVESSSKSGSNVATIINSFEYDSKGRYPIKSTNLNLNQSSVAIYDPRWGSPIWQKGIDGNVSEVFYDGYGKVVKTISPDNSISESKMSWVANGEISSNHPFNVNINSLFKVSNTSTLSPASKTYFDLLGREVLSVTESFNKLIYSAKCYNVRGNLVISTGTYDDAMLAGNSDYNKIVMQNTYNDFNQLITSTTSDGVVADIITTYSYEFPGNGVVISKVISPDNKHTSGTKDASGMLISASDEGGTINYTYNSAGQLLKTYLNGTLVSESHYNLFGLKYLFWEANKGNTTYDYYANGLLKSQMDSKNQTITLNYDNANRLTGKSSQEGTYTYHYIPSGNGINQLDLISSPNNYNTVEFEYDKLNRLTVKRESIKNLQNQQTQVFNTLYQYDSNNHLQRLTYPSGFAVDYFYDLKGFNTEIKRADNGASIWKANELNHLGKFTNYTMGNKPPSEIEFDNFGLLVEAKTAGIQDLYYTFDCKNGNMMQRKDLMRTLEENFTYDASDRLLTATVVGQNPVVTNYLPNGNIDNKTGLGTYTYDAKPNAVVSIENTDNIISNNTQDITYTSFDKALHMSEGDYTLDYAYGAYDERKTSKLINSTTNQTVCERLYLDGFERTIKNNNTIDITYINTPLGLSAMFVKENGNAGTLYYVYTDNIGSINTLIDDAGNKIEQSFDTWGNKRNFSDWTNTNLPTTPEWLYRGYTGHEHLNEFALINMNGRMYDPVVARFLSPDNQVQDPANTQNYNRYSYVMNNPLKYNDPSGWAYIGYQYFKPPINDDYVGVCEGDPVIAPPTGYTLDGVPVSVEFARFLMNQSNYKGVPNLNQFFVCSVTSYLENGAIMKTSEIVMTTNSYEEATGQSAGFTGIMTDTKANSNSNEAPSLPDNSATAGPGGIANTDPQDGSPTRENGGTINNKEDFENFMYSKAKDTPVEVGAFQLTNKETNETSYFVQPWNNNTERQSINDPSLVNQSVYTIVAVFHTHPTSSGPSRDDALVSQEYKIPVFTMGANGNMYVAQWHPDLRVPYWGTQASYGIFIRGRRVN